MPTNPRPSRKNPKRKFTPRVAGRSGADQSPAQPQSPAEPNLDPVESTPDRVEGTPDRVEGTPDPVEGTESPVDEKPDVDDETPEAETPANDDKPDDKPKPAGKRPVARVSTLRTGDNAATSPAPVASTTPSRTRTARSGSRTAVGLLAAVAVILGIFALIAGLHPGADIGSNKAFVDQPATTELTSQVQSKACALTVNSVDIDKWAGEARAVLTGQALTEFDQYLPQQREILGQTQAVADCRVESVGVADLSGGGDGDTARVVVNMIVSQQQAGVAGQSAAPRYQFGMVKQGDAWLINEVEAF